MGRKEARENTMKILFQMELTGNFSEDVLNIYMNNNEFDKGETNYINHSINKIGENLELIDQYINNNSHDWSVDRMANVDLAVLRIAVYEMLFREDIPVQVSINEAIEIVKKYSNEESYKFINGVLAGVVKDIEKNDKE